MSKNVDVKSDLVWSANAVALRDRITQKTVGVGVVGLGYVGLPLCMAFADAGVEVTGFDINQRVVDSLNAGESHILDIPSETVERHRTSGRFRTTADFAEMAHCDVYIVCVPTPLNKTQDPDISYLTAAVDLIEAHLRPGLAIVLESTTYPGTTRELVLPRIEQHGFQAGSGIFVAFSPERIDPGNTKFTVTNTPKVVGGIDPVSTELVAALYGLIIEDVVVVSSPEAAEMTKLIENTFRTVNIALANELALMCELLEIDVWEVIGAAATKPFGFMPFYPGPGIGGHCIPLDPFYLAWKMRTLNYKARFIDLANEINSYMPEHVVERITLALDEQRKSVRGSRILLLGMSYKANVGDLRESPSLDVLGLLQKRGADVAYHDPFIPSLELGDETFVNQSFTREAVDAADCIVILTDHDDVDYSLLDGVSTPVVDTRNALGKRRKN